MLARAGSPARATISAIIDPVITKPEFTTPRSTCPANRFGWGRSVGSASITWRPPVGGWKAA